MGKVEKITLVTPIKGNHFDLSRHLLDFQSFVKKFPLKWELIWVCHQVQTQNILIPEGIDLKIIESKTPRGLAVKMGLEKATGEIVCVFPMDWTVPLAEMFQFLQELILHPDFDMVLGNRKTTKKMQQSKKSSWHQTLENILLEKNSKEQADPLCAYWAIRNDKLALLLKDLEMRSWYYTPEVLEKAHSLQLKVIDAPILSLDKTKSQIPIWQEYFRQLFDSRKAR